MVFSRFTLGVACVLLCVAVSGCASGARPIANYEPDAFGASMYTRHYLATPAQTCEAARRALLSQGYVVTEAKPKDIVARKLFQPDVQHHVQVEFRVVCAFDGTDQSLAFASATQDQYVTRPASNSASVGVGAIGSLSLPFQGGVESMVKISSQTITNEDIYDALFSLMGGYLGSVERVHPGDWKPAESNAAPVTPPAGKKAAVGTQDKDSLP